MVCTRFDKSLGWRTKGWISFSFSRRSCCCKFSVIVRQNYRHITRNTRRKLVVHIDSVKRDHLLEVIQIFFEPFLYSSAKILFNLRRSRAWVTPVPIFLSIRVLLILILTWRNCAFINYFSCIITMVRESVLNPNYIYSRNPIQFPLSWNFINFRSFLFLSVLSVSVSKRGCLSRLECMTTHKHWVFGSVYLVSESLLLLKNAFINNRFENSLESKLTSSGEKRLPLCFSHW